MNHPFIRSEKRQAIKACRFSNLHTNHTFPPPPLHTALVSFLHPKQKGTTDMELSIQTVSMTYPSGKQALKGLNLDLKSPSLIGLLGPNGAGKSTLMKLLVAALAPTAGYHPGGWAAAGEGGAAAESPAGLSSPGLRAVRRAHRDAVSGLHGRPEGAEAAEGRHSSGDPGRQPGGEGQGPASAPCPADSASGWASPRPCWETRPS